MGAARIRNNSFDVAVKQLRPLYQKLVTMTPVDISDVPKVPGVYLFSKGATHYYVGRTKNLKHRIRSHYRRAPLAKKLAV